MENLRHRIEEQDAVIEKLRRDLSASNGRHQKAAAELEQLRGPDGPERTETPDPLDGVIKDLERIRKKLKRAPWRDTDDPVCDAFASMLAQSVAQARNTARKLRAYWPPEDENLRAALATGKACPRCGAPFAATGYCSRRDEGCQG
jgi:hypothetical protein